MPAPPVIATETARLAALQKYEVLDTPPEAAFDEIVELAARFCGTPTALVTLIDAKRQWFKARFGFTGTETARELAFCAHTIAQRDVMEVQDAAEDPRFASNPLVTDEPRIRFYAGAPLVTPDGHAVGSLAVIDYVPRKLTDEQRASLRALANQVVAQLSLGKSLAEIRRASDREIARRERRLSALFESALEGIIEMDPTGRIIEINPAAESMFGYTRRDVVNRDFADLMIPVRLREDHRSREIAPRTETIAQHADGSEFPIELTVTRLGREEPPVLVAFVRDLSEHRRAESELRKSIERFELVARATNDAIYDWDLRSNALWWSASFAERYGLRPDDIGPGIEWWLERIHPDDRPMIDASIQGVLDSKDEYWTGEYRFRRGDGSYATVLDRGYVTRDAEGRPVRMIGLLMDMTERHRLEEQLLRSQKMDAIGQLSGGIAHDFNNLLTIIQCNAFLIELSGHPDIKEPTRDLLAATERAANLTRQLLLVSRKQRVRAATINVQDIVGNMMRMLERVLGANILLRSSFDPSVPEIRADASMLEQVVLNLVVNARQAMPQGGILSIKTSLSTIKEPTRRHGLDVAPGTYACLTVSDTGLGISPDVLPQIFEPFFTTKEAGVGTGLGLSTVYGIVKQHQGWLDVTSEPGRGTSFVIALPVPTSPAPAQVAPPFRSDELPAGTETILLVEDEPLLRSRVASLLQSRGYTVIEAASGARALDIWHEQRGTIDLLLTDLVMPDGLSGRDLAVRLRAENASLPVLFTSGYMPEPTADERFIEGVNFVEKPFPPSKLLQVVRQVLDRKPG
jgi:PAS domain S-box-containing protein